MAEPDDGGEVSPTPFAAARSKVGAWLRSLEGASRALTRDEVDEYSGRGFKAGWRLPVKFADGIRELDLLLPVGFPWQPPRVALASPRPNVDWPHLERDGLLCLAPDTLQVDVDDPTGVVAHMLGEAVALINRVTTEPTDDDFQDELLSYWDFGADASAPSLVSLLNPQPPTRIVRVWRGKNFYLIAENDDELQRWLTNRFGTPPDNFKSAAAALVWVGAPIVPRDYPQSGDALLVLASRAGPEAIEVLRQIARERPEKIVTALGFSTANGPALVGVVASAPVPPRHGPRDPITKGFRANTVPDLILMLRYFGGGIVRRQTIQRADWAWIHGRGEDARAKILRGKTAALVGCGSLGAPVAVGLAQAGVGRVVLIDFDRLKWENVGRHPLGASRVGWFKAKALAEKLRADYPHMVVEHFDVDVDTMVRLHSNALDGCDLVVSTTGNWAADSRLDAWNENRDQKLPTVYGWLEAHACAGHAVLLDQSEGCLRCGFDSTGLPDFQITAWPHGATQRREPACGAMYQPYGPIELGFVNSLVAQLAIDSLLDTAQGPLHRIWVGSASRLHDVEGEWSAAWRSDSGFRDEGGFLLQRPWPIAVCKRCKKARAA